MTNPNSRGGEGERLVEHLSTLSTGVSHLTIQGRLDLLSMHPLIKSSVALPTPPVRELYVDLKRVVLLRDTGCCITSPSGFGKSFALSLIRAQFESDFPGLPVYKHSVFIHRAESVRSFFKHFLETARNRNTSGETYDLRSRLTHTLVDDTEYSDLGLILFLVDEAQDMLMSDYGFLKDVYNALADEGVHLIVILMGESPRFERHLEQLVTDARSDLINRFSRRQFLFRAIETTKDLQSVLREIDNAEFPEGSAVKWTEFFFPHAFRAGFRLENECRAFADSLARVSRSQGDGKGYPAKQIFSAIRALVVDNAWRDAPDMLLADGQWNKAVQWAKMQDALKLAYTGETVKASI
ncbi:AAA family ATPase [Paraburkholderia sp. FT54]|uniref:AAA family ATPase n=1 Tax=Paraburkholderia sp. FT54 TaxID=3074437 RepID=UPI002877E0B3|nr:AAA family ATPase [Paraburkholderia sp. FT54]WNC95033.1 AAA family ATPase [Paraburkholderia sp. FT54]